MRKKRLLVLFLILLSSGVVMAEDKHPFSVYDMLAMDRIGEQQVSPDGQTIVFSLRKTDLEANKGVTKLWLVDVNGKNLRELTSGDGSDYNPLWSQDGASIFFLSSRSGSSQVWKISTQGGDVVQVTDLPMDVGNLLLSPDGTHIAFTMDVFVGESAEASKVKLDAIEAAPQTGRIYDRIFIRHWDQWKDGRRSHLFVMPVSGGDPVDVMPQMDADTPSKPFGGAEEITFTPDGKGLVFTAREVGYEEPWSTNFDLFYVPIDASAVPQKLTTNEAWDTSPVFSPDGKTLAYLAMARPRYEADRFRIVLMNWESREIRVLTEAWDRSPGSILWSEDGKTIYTTADNLGQHSLFAIDTRSGEAKTLIRDGKIRSPQIANKRVVFGMEHFQSPVELYSILPNGNDLKSVTTINAEKVAATKMGDPEQFTFKGWNDETVYAYVVKPVDFDPSQKYPIAFLIHGGPQGSFGNDFHYRWNPQAYAGAGYAAVLVDFHGSTGYGQEFCDAIRGDWGGKPLEDLQKGLAAALEKYPWMDGERVGALGASYGGYMINWIAGNWPDRFKCLVCHDGNLDERMAYFDTEELWFPEWDHKGTPWDNPEGYEKQNPVNFVKNWKTPMLVVHGGQDFRVVETQGFATFNALQRKGIPSKLLYFPNENHWVLKPQNSVQWHETVIGWMDEWLK